MFGDPMEMMKEEPLHDDLVDYVSDGILGKMVHHPLIIAPLSMGIERCSLVNSGYRQKKEASDLALRERDFRHFVMLHERPYRISALLGAARHGLMEAPEEYWPLVGWVWTDSENIWENIDLWKTVWTDAAAPADRHLVMSDHEREEFSLLPRRIRIYRGHNYGKAQRGMSWTTDHRKAEWFAHRFQDQRAHVSTAYIDKEKVLAYFLNRGEKDIVVNPLDLKQVEYLSI